MVKMVAGFLTLSLFLLSTNAGAVEYKVAVHPHLMATGLNLGHAREMSFASLEKEMDDYSKSGWQVVSTSLEPEGSGYYTVFYVMARGTGGSQAAIAPPSPGVPSSTSQPAAAPEPTYVAPPPDPAVVPMTGQYTVHALKQDIKVSMSKHTIITLVTGLEIEGMLVRYDDGVLTLQTTSGISRVKESQIRDATQP